MKKKTYNVLLVDDDPIVLIGIGKELESEGYCVHTAQSGESALEFLESRKDTPDLVITDLIMGGINGIQVLKQSKKLNPGCMVMVLTGYGELKSAIEAIRFGADDYMLKPGSPEERSFRIREVLRKSELERKIMLYENLLPVCCVCKKIRDDSGKKHGTGDWTCIEEYLDKKVGVAVTSSYCPTCSEKVMKELLEEV